MILCDTSVMIDFYRGRPEVVDVFSAIGVSNLAVSVVTVGELFYGARDKRELRSLREHISSTHQFSIDEEVSTIYLGLLEKYALSHRLSIPDALIAATTLRFAIPLYTLNIKDFRYISGVSIYP
ncbi:MAG: type II toxin-antitoxin system VapC family toxin [Chloroflexi bacterium]|nr:type II toxin-antitoxin system VapC family toxin [Chloroflexota bacterium]